MVAGSGIRAVTVKSRHDPASQQGWRERGLNERELLVPSSGLEKDWPQHFESIDGAFMAVNAAVIPRV
jgi:hypothetical protein